MRRRHDSAVSGAAGLLPFRGAVPAQDEGATAIDGQNLDEVVVVRLVQSDLDARKCSYADQIVMNRLMGRLCEPQAACAKPVE